MVEIRGREHKTKKPKRKTSWRDFTMTEKIEDEQESKSAEDWIKEQWGEAWLRNEWEASDVIQSMKEYASLPAKQSVTDEDIEKWAIEFTVEPKEYFLTDVVEEVLRRGIVYGAKAMRDGQIPKK